MTGVDTAKSSTFGAGVFGHYYFLELGERFKTYASGNLSFGRLKSGLGNGDVTTNGASLGDGIAINYFVTEVIILRYSTSKVDIARGKNSSRLGLGLNGNVVNLFARGSFGVGCLF
ncbi:hypothetical protein SAMN05444396_101393 [Flavobacterium segetis]|uniref:Outer membrane protein beta-barrel domain-containing protein n=1 Tax=Flavobacterium segetis TaxID=271157 RepID=A0A1M5EHQ8_9FLAO|nr:hypothetical protein [Flavobacterium segetis]SHF78785.1 hypothetical protein SAMN05444396_101393 [Flavobacterium segetis]